MNPREEWQLATRQVGRHVLLFDRIDSTNKWAATLAVDANNHGVVVLAHDQTAGRGQHGRRWLSPPGSSVLASLLLLPPPALRRPVLLTAWAAVSVCETIRKSTGLEANIKWPNDVLIRGRKVCGILIEQGQGTVVGIGLNVNQTADMFAAADLPLAGSLAMFDGCSRDVKEIAKQLICQLDDGYQRLCDNATEDLETCWKHRLGLLGKFVTAECADRCYSGLLREVAFDGLELETPEGEIHRLPPEAVRRLEAV